MYKNEFSFDLDDGWTGYFLTANASPLSSVVFVSNSGQEFTCGIDSDKRIFLSEPPFALTEEQKYYLFNSAYVIKKFIYMEELLKKKTDK